MTILQERVATYSPDIAVAWSPIEVPSMFVESWSKFAHFYGQNVYNQNALADVREWTGFSTEEIKEQKGEYKKKTIKIFPHG